MVGRYRPPHPRTILPLQFMHRVIESLFQRLGHFTGLYPETAPRGTGEQKAKRALYSNAWLVPVAESPSPILTAFCMASMWMLRASTRRLRLPLRSFATMT